MTFRDLTKDEIQVRVAKVIGNHANLLIYKDARVDINILNDVYGIGWWKKKYEMVGEYLTCIIYTYNKELKEWIPVQDVGTESNFQAEKGAFSDAMKRACFNLGIGIELYTVKDIWVSLTSTDFTKDKKINQSFYVDKIKTENKIIKELVIIDRSGKVRFDMNNTKDIEDKAIEKLSPSDFKKYYVNEVTYLTKTKYKNRHFHTIASGDLNKIREMLYKNLDTANEKTKSMVEKAIANIENILKMRGDLNA